MCSPNTLCNGVPVAVVASVGRARGMLIGIDIGIDRGIDDIVMADMVDMGSVRGRGMWLGGVCSIWWW